VGRSQGYYCGKGMGARDAAPPLIRLSDNPPRWPRVTSCRSSGLYDRVATGTALRAGGRAEGIGNR
jgi:hypothetical protein